MKLLKDIAEVLPGTILPERVPYLASGRYRLIQPEDVDLKYGLPWNPDKKHSNGDPPWLRYDVPEGQTLLRFVIPGDILFHYKGPYRRAIAIPYTIQASGDLVVSASRFHILRLTCGDYNPEFLAWYLNQYQAQNTLCPNPEQDGLRTHATRAMLEDLEIPEVPLSDQDAMLGAVYSFQELIDASYALIEKKKLHMLGVTQQFLKRYK